MKTNHIQMHPITSSQIHSIGHDPATNTLAVCFCRKGGPGSVYHYSGFTPEQFTAFKGAESIGSHFGKHIKGNEKHPFTKIDEPQEKT